MHKGKYFSYQSDMFSRKGHPKSLERLFQSLEWYSFSLEEQVPELERLLLTLEEEPIWLERYQVVLERLTKYQERGCLRDK